MTETRDCLSQHQRRQQVRQKGLQQGAYHPNNASMQIHLPRDLRQQRPSRLVIRQWHQRVELRGPKIHLLRLRRLLQNFSTFLIRLSCLTKLIECVVLSSGLRQMPLCQMTRQLQLLPLT